MKTRKERSKLVDIITDIWKKLTDPEKDDEFEEVNRQDTGKFKKYLREHQYFCFVAVVNDVIVGEIISEIKEVKKDGIFKQRRLLFIEDICIDKNYTRKGIGRKLCDMAKQLAREENVSSIELNVWAFNKNAINFYEKLGFTCKSMRYEYNII